MPRSPVAGPVPEGGSLGRRLALVVGVTDYLDASLRRLPAPATDAAELRDLLADPEIGGFTVTSVINEKAHQLRVAIEDFLADRHHDDLLLVYLSCHGLVDNRRRLYFAARDTLKHRLAASGVESQWLLDQLEDCRARSQVVILDCCFSGAFARGAKGDDDLGLGERLMGDGRGRVVLTASRATEYSFEGEPLHGEGTSRGSVFTSALIEGIQTGDADRDRDGDISVEDAFAYAFEQIRRAGTPQTPQRWLYGAEGSILLAHTPPAIAWPPAPLPAPTHDPAPAPAPALVPAPASASVPGGAPDPAPDPGWFAAHTYTLAGAGAVALVLAVMTVLLANRGGDEPKPDAVTALSETQLLVAAGDSVDSMNIYVVDTAGGVAPVQLNEDITREGGPSIGPERDIVAYPEAMSETSFQLRAMAPTSGEQDQQLLASIPGVCARSMGRPAWLPPGMPGGIVAPCRDAKGEPHLVRLTMDGAVQVDYAEVLRRSGHDVRHAGDPTVSEDGQNVVFWASTDDDYKFGGDLWRVDIEGTAPPQRIFEAEERFPGQYSDAIFFDEGRSLAYRKTVDGTGFDIYTCELDQPQGTEQALVASRADEEDPAVSPDGTRVAYKLSPALTSNESQIWWIGMSDGAPDGVPARLLPESIATVESVPSWSRR